MRVCNSCGRENPDDRDFCECGEYLRWDPTGVVQAITPEVLQAAQQQANTDAGVPAADAPAPAQPERPPPLRRRRPGHHRAAASGRPPRGAAGPRVPRQRPGRARPAPAARRPPRPTRSRPRRSPRSPPRR